MFRSIGSVEVLECRKLLDAGELDIGFAANGSLSAADAGSTIVVQLHDGRFVTVTGNANSIEGVKRVTLRHFSRDGLADVGRVTSLAPSKDYSAAQVESITAAADSRDRLFVGVAGGIVCVLPNGKVDKTFGANGVIAAPMETVKSLFVQRDDKLVVGGNFTRSGEDSFGDFVETDSPALVRLTARGKRDTTFGTKGIRLQGSPVGGSVFVLETGTIDRIEQDAQGRLVVTRTVDSNDTANGDDNNTHTTTLRRVNADGTEDKTLAVVEERTRFTQFDSSPLFGNDPGRSTGRALEDFTIDRSGRILVTVNEGESRRTEGEILKSGIWRIKSDGTADTSFSSDGFADAFLSVATSADSVVVRNVEVDSAGRILADAALFDADSGTSDVYLVRLKSDGSIDTTFGVNGSTLIGNQLQVNEIALAPSGSVLVNSRKSNTAALRRYWSNNAPTVDAEVKHIRTATPRPQTFDLTVRDDDGVDPNTLDRDLRITGPNGFVAYARFFAEVTSSDNGKTIVARYKLAAPGGSWDANDNGEYIVQLVNRAISDTSGNGADGRILGSFLVRG